MDEVLLSVFLKRSFNNLKKTLLCPSDNKRFDTQQKGFSTMQYSYNQFLFSL